VSYYKCFVYLRFQGYNFIEDVEELIGKTLQVKRTASPALPDGVYYHYEILDSEVYTEQNQRLGKVIDILETGAHDVYVVQGDEREYLIPVTREIVTQINREKGIITVRPIEGLLDL
jgi:16S rRNA processing protein RimM